MSPCAWSVCLQQQVCIQSVTVVLDEDVSRQVTLTREGEVILGVNPAPALPYVDGRSHKSPLTHQRFKLRNAEITNYLLLQFA